MQTITVNLIFIRNGGFSNILLMYYKTT